jgi:uncharacterized protein YjbI with pentapeptide repeats
MTKPSARHRLAATVASFGLAAGGVLLPVNASALAVSPQVRTETCHKVDKAQVGGPPLVEADFHECDFSGANLTGANLSGANLSGANLHGAYLGAVDFSRANLTRANLRGAKLWDANLRGADLTGADLSKADLIYASVDCQTRWPKGFNSVAAGASQPDSKCS